MTPIEEMEVFYPVRTLRYGLIRDSEGPGRYRGGLGVLSPEPAEPGDFWQVQLCNGEVAIATIPGFCRFCRQVVPGAHLIGIEFGIEAGILMALGVPAEDIARDLEPEIPKVDNQTFVPPHRVIADDAA